MPRCLARWLLFGVFASACQRAEPCSNDELQRGVEAVTELRDAHPLRIGSFDFEFGAGSRILAACPGLAVLHGLLDFGGVMHDPGSDAVRLHEMALRQTCVDLDAARDARADVLQSCVGRDVATGSFYEPCDFGRFELVDPIRLRERNSSGTASARST